MRKLKNHYATLEIDQSATKDDILKARRRMLRIWHPDLNRERIQEAKDRTIEILHAAEVLSDASMRTEYDQVYRNVYGTPIRQTATSYKTPHTSTSAAGAHRQTVVVCPECHRNNINPKHRYCIYCGAGIGPNGKPFSYEDIDRDVLRNIKRKDRSAYKRKKADSRMSPIWNSTSPKRGGIISSKTLLIFIFVLWEIPQFLIMRPSVMKPIYIYLIFITVAILFIVAIVLYFINTDATLK